ncbi:MAG: ribosome recycling factor [Proteobacteria bacterium]|nr:ribosome recycling factor [Pseudomonadota bacterium]
MADPDLDDLTRRMNGAIEALSHEFAGLRTGRASIGLLEPVMVDIYGMQMPLNQVGTIGVPEPRMLTVQVWDKGAVASVDKAIRAAGLGLNPSADGQLLRVPIPELTEERRLEMAKIAHKYAEQARVAVRNVRRDGMDNLKKMERDGELSEDDQHLWGDEIQQLTDKMIARIDQALAAKDEEIMKV